MVQNNKVLTVSYGTFSCTLEGFDDSFETMKAIAEYFRDLAADDRYFGAEPPQPDAEMLARIAQREISRQVEARREATGIVLRAAEPIAAPFAAPAAETTQAETAAAPEAEVVEEPDIADEAPAEEEALVEDVQDEPAAPAVTAETAEAEAEAEEYLAEDEPEPVTPSPEVASEEQPAVAERTYDEEFEDADDILAGIAARINDDVETENWPETFAMPEAEPVEETSPARPAADSIAAKLQRIRAVVSRNEQSARVEPDYSEDEHAEDMASENIVPETRADIPGAPEADYGFDTDEDEGLPTSLSDEYEDEPEAAPKPQVAVRVAVIKGAKTPQAEPEQPEEEALVGSLSPEDEEDLLRELAAVEAEYFAGRDVFEDEDEDQIEEGAEDYRDSLFAEADEDADETDLDESEDASFFADDQDEDTDQDENDEGTLRAEADDVSRLMAAADEKLGDPDLSSQRETYSQMRAAVASTHAERSAGGTYGTRTNDDDDYRKDLAEVVRPRRPVASGQAPRSREEARPAPLKLVAEQRIDTPRAAATRGPVLPRRVANLVSDDAPAAATEGNFADFVAETGASGLHELLEAAAAYMSFVERRDHFSRPQLMNKVRQLDDQEFNREDGLRSFGQLLREGKLKKTANGQFTASGQIGFRPDKRAAS
ncbi:hypothetical protein [Ruegeria marina]|uniref:Chemotaxis protein CheA n=1 Tax=Ruegeria marina TaxID=639004 RepID=A0A1G6SI13_9RHOB|nr:hypothetical protein [Ruegeria marina]SDD15787.1 hypothetical protein SAMN04488239_105270 [Ruegeria marina]